MPFQDQEESRAELCRLALAEGSNRRELCRPFNIQPRILYKWLERDRTLGAEGLADRSRRPHRSPSRRDDALETRYWRCGVTIRYGRPQDRGEPATAGRGAAGAVDDHRVPAGMASRWWRRGARSGSASSMPRPMRCGRWTSRVTCHSRWTSLCPPTATGRARAFRQEVKPFDYAVGDIVRSVDTNGRFSFAGQQFKASKAPSGKRIALRPTDHDGVYDLVFRTVVLKPIDLHR